jgi:kinesin family protein C2/C3
VLGRDFTRDECDATDVSIFDTAAVTCQLDGNQLAAITGDALRAMGFVRYEHRAAIMDWIRHRLEVRPGVFFPPRWQSGNERRVSALDHDTQLARTAKLSATARDTRRTSPRASRQTLRASVSRAKATAMSPPRVRHRKLAAVEHLVSAVARLSVVSQPSPSNASTSRQDEALSPVAASAADASSPETPAADPSRLVDALAEANERALRYARDATESLQEARRASDDTRRAEAALASARSSVPKLRAAHGALRGDTRLALESMHAAFANTVALVESRAKRAVAALEAEKAYQTNRAAALAAKNRALRRRAQESRGAIRVCVRTRPLDARASAAGHIPSVRPTRGLDPGAEGEEVLLAPQSASASGPGGGGARNRASSREAERRPASRRAEEKRFAFDRVFGPDATQSDVYAEISPLVTGALDGFSACVFAYGQTGSGKTHTMGGAADASPGDAGRGLNERALAELFEAAEARREDAEGGLEDAAVFTIAVEMREIYNERVRDLLVPLPEKEEIWRGGAAGERMLDASAKPARNAEEEDECVASVTRVVVRDAAHALDVIREGASRRASAATALNERSSRSHSVVTVSVEGALVASGARVAGRLHLVDLAGSERVSRSEASGDRLKEAQHINKSLSALGDVVAALLEKRAHVPFRNSKLTGLLADSLGGDAKVALLAHLAPEPASLPETASTLLFAQRCSRVELGRARANALASKSACGAAPSAALEAALREARARASAAKAENDALRAEVASLKARRGDGNVLSPEDASAELTASVREPLSPLAKTNARGFGGSLTPMRPQSAAKARRAIGRAAASASSTIMREG